MTDERKEKMYEEINGIIIGFGCDDLVEIWNYFHDCTDTGNKIREMYDFDSFMADFCATELFDIYENTSNFSTSDEYYYLDDCNTLYSSSDLGDFIEDYTEELIDFIIDNIDELKTRFSNVSELQEISELLKEETEISKTITKIYVVEDNTQKAVAEVIENCGCGFEWLIRVNPDYKYDKTIINKCLAVLHTVVVEWNEESVNKWIENGYVNNHETMAFIVDEVI